MPSISATLRHLRRGAAVAAVTAGAVALAACSSSSSSSGASTSASSGPASAATSATPINIAYLSFAVENSYDAPMLAAAQGVASANPGVTIKVFDASNSPQTQYSQLQDAINSGQYQAVITQPIFGTGLVSLVKQAIAKHITVVNMDQILGPNLATDAPQVPGMAANVVFVPTEIGTKLGKLVVQACASKNLNPCNVGYLYDIKASALDVAIYGAFTKAIASSPVKIVTTGQSFFSPTTGLTAVQNMIQSQPNLNLIVGSDQGIEGGAQAIAAKHLTGKIILVGYGASAAALQGVSSGAWYGDVAQAPASEGRLAVQAVIDAIRKHKDDGGVDPVASLPNGGVVTRENASQFTAEWPG